MARKNFFELLEREIDFQEDYEKIEDAIHKGIYDELLDKTELKLKKLFSSYAVEDILALINRVIIFHNYNIDCKENDYSKYQRNKHMSLRILLSLPQYYYEESVKLFL